MMEASPGAAVRSSLLMLAAGSQGLGAFDTGRDYQPVHSAYNGVDMLDVRAHSSGSHVVALSKKGGALKLAKFVEAEGCVLEWSDCPGLVGKCLDLVESDVGCEIAIGRSNRSAGFVDLSGRKRERVISTQNDPLHIASIGKAAGLAVSFKGRGDIQVFNKLTVKLPEFYSFSGGDVVNDVRASPLRPQLVAAAYKSGYVALWDVGKKTEEPLVKVRSHVKDEANAFAFSLTNQKLGGSCSSDGNVQMLGFDTKKMLAKVQVGLPLTALTFVPRSQEFAVGTEGGVIKVWDLRNSKKALYTVEDAGVGSVRAISFCAWNRPAEMSSSQGLTERPVRDAPVAFKRSTNGIEDAAKENRLPLDPSPEAEEAADDELIHRQPIGEARSDPSPQQVVSPSLRAPTMPARCPSVGPSPVASVRSSAEDAVFSHSEASSSATPSAPMVVPDDEETINPIAVAGRPRTSNELLAVASDVIPEVPSALQAAPMPERQPCACQHCGCATPPPVTKEDVEAVVRSCLGDVFKDILKDPAGGGEVVFKDKVTPPSGGGPSRGPLTNGLVNDLERIVANMTRLVVRMSQRDTERSLERVEANISRQNAEFEARMTDALATMKRDLMNAVQSGAYSMWLGR